MARLRESLGLPEVPADEKAKALADPGPNWGDWFYFEFAKAWILLLLFVLDAWLALLFLQPLDLPGLAASIVLAVYGEFLLYRYLWTRPSDEENRRVAFRPTWLRPVRYGRWTPEMRRIRAGLDPSPDLARGPDPKEFL